MTIVAADRRKLVRFLGMLGSEHEGEVFNAARMALRLLKDRGFTWDDVVVPAAPDIVIEPKTARKPAYENVRPATRPRPQQPPPNPWSFRAADLMGAMVKDRKRKRINATDLSLINRALNPLYYPSPEEAERLRQMYVDAFGKAEWSKAS